MLRCCRARRSRTRLRVGRVARWRSGTKVASWRSSLMGSRACCGILRCVFRFAGRFDSRLTSLQAEDRKDLVLVLFKDLVQNQFPSFSGDEIRVFNLLFLLREDPSRSVSPSAPLIPTNRADLLRRLPGHRRRGSYRRRPRRPTRTALRPRDTAFDARILPPATSDRRRLAVVRSRSSTLWQVLRTTPQRGSRGGVAQGEGPHQEGAFVFSAARGRS